MEVSFHVLKHKIKIFIVFSSDDLMQLNNVSMLKLLKKYDFPIGSLSISWMLESIEYFFESKSLAIFLVGNFPNNTIGSTSNFFDYVVSLKDMSFYFLWHFLFIISQGFRKYINKITRTHKIILLTYTSSSKSIISLTSTNSLSWCHLLPSHLTPCICFITLATSDFPLWTLLSFSWCIFEILQNYRSGTIIFSVTLHKVHNCDKN